MAEVGVERPPPLGNESDVDKGVGQDADMEGFQQTMANIYRASFPTSASPPIEKFKNPAPIPENPPQVTQQFHDSPSVSRRAPKNNLTWNWRHPTLSRILPIFSSSAKDVSTAAEREGLSRTPSVTLSPGTEGEKAHSSKVGQAIRAKLGFKRKSQTSTSELPEKESGQRNNVADPQSAPQSSLPDAAQYQTSAFDLRQPPAGWTDPATRFAGGNNVAPGEVASPQQPTASSISSHPPAGWNPSLVEGVSSPDVRQLLEENTRLKHDLQALRQVDDAKEAALHRIQLANQGFAHEASVLRRQLSSVQQLQSDMDNLTGKYATHSEHMKDLEQKYASLNVKYAELKASHTETLSQKSELERQVSNMQSAHNTLVEQKVEAQSKAYALERSQFDAHNLREQVTHLEREADDQRRIIALQLETISQLNNQIAEFNSTIAQLNSQITELNKAIQYRDAIAQESVVRIQSSQKRMRELQRLLHEKDKMLAEVLSSSDWNQEEAVRPAAVFGKDDFSFAMGNIYQDKPLKGSQQVHHPAGGMAQVPCEADHPMDIGQTMASVYGGYQSQT
ncbi:uncharacterized protein SPPG_05198 [Spizellomyces punctatus DAOM BR117]|uniref:Uncharacterized protein n=1 Tax=Spizellomyces punctatus (strain DAOM BR117) TaxID=645134 RepID=A0A0L0HFW4_SPIPD|nr:uncharacterized protein SPPG_05198 [Spizellomyces punctatus DAOM BR117]KNC99824.1 hypothetical protein SPPG_05198 [Spizellomyces punctatus DAOM BR117]|eukprot:XP_016607864.1 hypothetical protein SPPG_05198 [Spizellomyces punctatus DAOM BR117]